MNDADVKGSAAFLRPLLAERFGTAKRHLVALGELSSATESILLVILSVRLHSLLKSWDPVCSLLHNCALILSSLKLWQIVARASGGLRRIFLSSISMRYAVQLTVTSFTLYHDLLKPEKTCLSIHDNDTSSRLMKSYPHSMQLLLLYAHSDICKNLQFFVFSLMYHNLNCDFLFLL